MSTREVEGVLQRHLARILQEPAENIDLARSLSELGLDSVGYVDLARFIRETLGVPLSVETLYEFNSLRETAAHLASLMPSAAAPSGAEASPLPAAEPVRETPPEPSVDEHDVAIVGVGLRVPGAKNLEELWSLVSRGDSMLREFPLERVAVPEAPSPMPGYLRGGFAEDVDAFDAAFFGISPREALAMDPQQRLLMECAWHTFEDGGYGPERLSGTNTAVYVGASSFDYYELLLQTQAARTTHIGTGISHAILANRISQYFNLKGASDSVDTACSSSLVALHRGVQALRSQECDLALVGGVNVLASRTPFQVFADAGMLSPQGLCRPFDDSAAGYVRGEGVACVVLKRASAALRDSDRILAIIKGGAVRHSGRTHSLTAPNPDAQAEVIGAALKDARVDASSIGYVEAHGTGTALGDPVEVRGLKKAFARPQAAPDAAPHFYIGSVKAQVGHLEAAAGLAGLLKVVAALAHQAIPGSPYLTQLNRHVDLSDARFRIPSHVLPWDGSRGEVTPPVSPRRAGVSSFGFGGVNAHVVLEEAPALPVRTATARPRLFLLSARTSEALEAQGLQLARHLSERTFADMGTEQSFLEDVAFTLRHGRHALAHRAALVARSVGELVERLGRLTRDAGGTSPEVLTGVAQGEPQSIQELFASEQALQAHLGEMAARGELHKLARLWTQGLGIDWAQVLPRDGAALVALPGYPFARERFWVRRAQGETTAAPLAPRAPAVAFYTPRWVPRPLPAPQGNVSGSLVALVDGERGRSTASMLARLLPLCTVKITPCPSAQTSAQTAATELLQRIGSPGAVVDLTPLDENLYQDSGRVLRKLEFLRHVTGGALRRGEPLSLVQATLGLQRASASSLAGAQDAGSAGLHKASASSLAGAQDAGFFKHFSAEYRRCRSKTVDVPAEDFSAEVLAAQLAHELEHHDGEGEVAYFGGQRLTRELERASVPTDLATPERGENDVALITGGLGDIGLRVAQDLAERGFRALLLTGRREPSADKRAVLEALERQGTTVVLYRGALEDEHALGQALAAFRARHGAITHVFHCAGAVDRKSPAFFQKTAESMAEVMSPKVDALHVLHRLFESQPPRAFVLFSSLSSVASRVAAGVLDYAAANRFMDHFAQHQHALGRRYYHSIQWTRWQELGMARGAHESQGGGQPLAVDLCLAALRHVLATGQTWGPTVCVLAEGDTVLQAAPAPEPRRASTVATPAPREAAPRAGLDAIRSRLRAIAAKELETDESKLDDHVPFEEMGIDSIVMMGLVSQLETWLGRTVDPEAVIRAGTLAEVTRYLATLAPAEALAAPPPPAPEPAAPLAAAPLATSKGDGPFRVAIIGMACHFPEAPDKETFWRNLVSGKDCVSQVPSSRWDTRALYSAQHQPGKSISQWGGFIQGIEWLDPTLFSVSAEEAASIDPLIRLFTECSLAAVLDSPYEREGLKGKRVGVFAGARSGSYAERIAVPGKHSVSGIGQNFISAYVSHLLDLRGPSLVLDSACSSSLAAVHLACQSLRSGDSELAIAGGVEVLLEEKVYQFLSAAHALSPDGRCRTFDARANGFVPGEGVGCVLLKPLDRALADGDPIYAVLDGGAMNNDGSTLGVTTPGVEGQVDVISRALGNAGLSPRSISYVEAHGTGTMIGDPIELRALARAFAHEPPERCAIGSVKTNFGHLLSAAGVASLIKVALCLHHRTLVPTLHCEQVNPRFEFDRTPFRPQREAQSWEVSSGPRRAGISSFGFGKTNVHLILGERPEQAARPQDLEAARRPIPDDARVFAWHPTRPTPPPLSIPSSTGDGLLELEGVSIEEFEQVDRSMQ
ncbi:polyketide synthase [Myxococcus stipitatus DSM 14675]|uniref:Polyketide synthase n=1 Tax=Myxococcus stipitatus (strain DSM 14675 / JCM 12634 / Mx s8) TaxID=1278073 RepID=L7U504_MYXSD|nr:SDR family NAD(P)-dependent oxidoreductase [Myxococcus stipitatus]AGC43223.1 polyketide synthase [Myxococcus stipitatus DSM 14675]